MGVYTNRIQAPTKTLTSDWIPEDGELFRDEAGNLYMGDNVTASDALDPINADVNGAGVFVGLNYTYSSTTSASGIAAGTFRLDNAAFGSATKLYIHDTDGLAYDQSDYWDLFTSGTITMHRSSPEGYVTFKVTRMVAQTGYHEFDVVRVGGATGFTNADEIRLAVTMDAPGVRELCADFAFSDPLWSIAEVHKNTLKADVTIGTTSGSSFYILSDIGTFTANTFHAVAMGIDTDGVLSIPCSIVPSGDGGNATITLNTAPSGQTATVQLIIKKYH